MWQQSNQQLQVRGGTGSRTWDPLTYSPRNLVGLTLIFAVPPRPISAWAVGMLAELAEQGGEMVEHQKSKSTKPKSEAFTKRD